MTQEQAVKLPERRLSSRNKLENRREEVIAAFVQGWPWSQIQQHFDCKAASLGAFRERHLEEIEGQRAKVAKAVEDYAIASKVFRIGELDHLYGEMRKELDEYGMFVTEVATDDDGKRIETRDFRAAMVKELKGTLRQAAEELAQLPRAPDANINVNVGLAVALVWQDGSEA